MSSKPKLLDLFCGAGGASVGYHRAGFEVVGVDINPQPNYPFKFYQGDAMTLEIGDDIDVVHASPPCQAYSKLRALHPAKEYVDLVEPCRQKLQATGKPYLIENVVGAPLIDPVLLCGSMFDCVCGEFYLQRHRLFESNRFIHGGTCKHKGIAIGVFGRGSNHGRKNSKGQWRGRQASPAEAKEAMQIDWMKHHEITQAIPPAYTEFLGRQILWGMGA